MSGFEFKALIIAVDKLSPTVKVMNKNLNVLRRQLEQVGKGGIAMGAGLSAGLAVATKAFMAQEDATTTLMNSLMTKDGNIPEIFKAINQQAIELGNQLPGATKDFADMATQLKSLGVKPETILGGALKATAYLALVSKDVGVNYDTATDAIGKLANAYDIADDKLVGFADSLQKVLHNGTKLEELNYAMLKPAGVLKAFGMTGDQVARDMLPLVSVLTKKGYHGEEVSTGLATIFEVIHKHKPQINTIGGFVKELDKLNHLPEAKRLAIMSATKEKGGFGEHWTKAALIDMKAYQASMDMMNAQGDMMLKIGNISNQLSTKVEAAGGTWENFMAGFSTAYATELKGFTDQFNDMAGKMADWTIKNGSTIKVALEMAGAFAGLKIASLALAGGIGILTTAMKLNPLMLLAQVVALAAPLIIDNWDSIVDRFKSGISNILEFFTPLKDMLQYVVDWVTHNPFLKFIGSIPLYLGNSVMKAMPDLPDLSIQGSGGMRPPGFQKQSLLGAGRGGVDVRVSFDNSPSGMRVAPVQTSGIARANSVDVGYRSIGTRYGI